MYKAIHVIQDNHTSMFVMYNIMLSCMYMYIYMYMHVHVPHEVDQGGDISHHRMIPGKYLCPGGTVPREPVSILLCQVSCSTHVEDVFIEPACM